MLRTCCPNLVPCFPRALEASNKLIWQNTLSKPSGSPVEKKLYPLPMVKMDWVHNEVERLLKASIIRHSVSPWCSPVIVIDKKQIPGQQKGGSGWLLIIELLIQS